ncbi:hypothetical protein TCAL_16184, partial [Tigriopus californicus]
QDSCPLASDGSMFGTCVTAAECSNQGGSAHGSCFSGFGACCSFTLCGCGGTVTKNCSYIQICLKGQHFSKYMFVFRKQNSPVQQPHLKIAYSTLITLQTQDSCLLASDGSMFGTCLIAAKMFQSRLDFGSFEIAQPPTTGVALDEDCLDSGDSWSSKSPTQANPPVIWIDYWTTQLDFGSFEIAQPPTTGVALDEDCLDSGDSLVLKSPTQANPPVICGLITGQHMYIEIGDSGTAGSATITIGPMIGTRTYQIKVTYLECSNLS